MEVFLTLEPYHQCQGNQISVKISNSTVTGNPDTPKVTTLNKSFIISNDTTIVADSSTLIVTSPDEKGKMNIVRKGVKH